MLRTLGTCAYIDGIHTDSDKVQAIMKFTTFTSVTNVNSFLNNNVLSLRILLLLLPV